MPRKRYALQFEAHIWENINVLKRGIFAHLSVTHGYLKERIENRLI